MSNSDFSDSDSSQDIDLEDKVTKNNNLRKVYQLQHDKDDLFKFKFMGLFENLPEVNLGNFNIDNMNCYLASHFVFADDINNINNTLLPDVNEGNTSFDILSLNLNKNGRLSQLKVGIEFTDNIDINNLNTGKTYIRYIDTDKNINEIIKKNLTYPGSNKILYYLVAELNNDKIHTYINDE